MMPLKQMDATENIIALNWEFCGWLIYAFRCGLVWSLSALLLIGDAPLGFFLQVEA
jgi:hypothetical protein